MGQKNLEFLGFGLKISREGWWSQFTYLHRYDVLRYTNGGIIIALFSVRKGRHLIPNGIEQSWRWSSLNLKRSGLAQLPEANLLHQFGETDEVNLMRRKTVCDGFFQVIKGRIPQGFVLSCRSNVEKSLEVIQVGVFRPYIQCLVNFRKSLLAGDCYFWAFEGKNQLQKGEIEMGRLQGFIELDSLLQVFFSIF